MAGFTKRKFTDIKDEYIVLRRSFKVYDDRGMPAAVQAVIPGEESVLWVASGGLVIDKLRDNVAKLGTDLAETFADQMEPFTDPRLWLDLIDPRNWAGALEPALEALEVVRILTAPTDRSGSWSPGQGRPDPDAKMRAERELAAKRMFDLNLDRSLASQLRELEDYHRHELSGGIYSLAGTMALFIARENVMDTRLGLTSRSVLLLEGMGEYNKKTNKVEHSPKICWVFPREWVCRIDVLAKRYPMNCAHIRVGFVDSSILDVMMPVFKVEQPIMYRALEGIPGDRPDFL